jgi:hypothetical protein
VKIPNADHAIIEQQKLVDYLLNTEHRRGGSKAALLALFGYSTANWERLAADLRDTHLSADVTIERTTPYGQRYEIRAPLATPSGRLLMISSIWQIDQGTDRPRLITLYPD